MVTFRNELNFPLQRMILVEKGEDGYPLLQEGKIYYYGNENYYTEFTDTIDSIKSKWPSRDSVPDFYEILSVPYDPNDHTGVNSLYYLLRPNDPVYNIDLNTREVEAPPFLSVSGDHQSEVIFFKVDRFFDDVDLYGCTCWVQYKNKLGENYISIVIPKPVDDNNHNVLYIPWTIRNTLAKEAGNVTFSIRFFKLDKNQKVNFSLNTKPATSKIILGIDGQPDDFLNDDTNPQYSDFMEKFQVLSNKYDRLEKKYELYWEEA